MGADGGGDGAKELAGRAEESWSFYTAQAQTMGKQALSSTDEALKTARLQLGQLQDASSQHLDVAKVNHSHPFFQISAAPLAFLSLFSKWYGDGVLPHPSPSFIMWIRVYSEVGVYWHFYFVSVVVSRGSSIFSHRIAGVHKVGVM
jgi:hypothetical protein